MWRILEYHPGNDYKAPDGTLKTQEPFYYPGGKFPDPAELVILRCDIESFEARIAEGNQSASTAIGSRERETLLNIIGGMLALLLGKTPAGKPQSVFESQAAVIHALLAHYDGKAGIAKRTLEDKLARAKHNLASS